MFAKNFVLIAFLVAGICSTNAMAKCGRGELGKLYGSITGDCGGANAADNLHEQVGRPGDAWAAGAVDTVAPGVGSTWYAYDAYKRSMNRTGSAQSTGSSKCRTQFGICNQGFGPVGSQCGCSWGNGRIDSGSRVY